MREIKGLAELIASSSGMWQNFERPEYPSLYCCMGPSLREFYRELGYPLGKSIRGLKRWLKRNYTNTGRHWCKVHGKETRWVLKRSSNL